MKKIIITIAATLAVLLIGALIFITSGIYNVSQLSPHNKLTLSVIEMTTHNSINKRLKTVTVPANLKDSALLVTGFRHYNEMCVSCHSAPGQQPSEMVEGLYPKPPVLYTYTQEDDAREYFWIIQNGIKMTSMPAYKPTHDDEKLWAITAFVTQKLPKMKAEEYKNWMEKYAKGDKEE